MTSRDHLRGRVAYLMVADRATIARVREVAARERDVAMIVVPLDEAAGQQGCRAEDPELAKALALYRGNAAGPSAGMELLVDPSGSLRAIWSPGGKPDWRDNEVMERELAAIRDNPVAVRPIGSHLHPR
jgi:hypothetical protein